jgi:hypothetical protein
MANPPVVVGDYTEETLAGTGTFDVMMRSVKSHIKEEYNQGRIKGPEYSTVYLGALNSVMQTSLQFLLSRDKLTLENAQLELANIKISKENLLLDEQIKILYAEYFKVSKETDLIVKQIEQLTATIAVANAEELKINADKLRIDAQTTLFGTQFDNAASERALIAEQICKLKAEFSVLEQQVMKVTAEKELLAQKKATELAQIDGSSITTNSVIGKQNSLFAAQTKGFEQNASQKAADTLITTWLARRTTNTDTVAEDSGSNKNNLGDQSIARAVAKMAQDAGISNITSS